MVCGRDTRRDCVPVHTKGRLARIEPGVDAVAEALRPVDLGRLGSVGIDEVSRLAVRHQLKARILGHERQRRNREGEDAAA